MRPFYFLETVFEYPRSPSATRSRASTPTTSSRAVAILQLPLPAGPLARAQHRVRGSAARSDEFVVDDFVLTTGSVDVVSKMKFKEWASAFHGEDQCSSV